jgi:hypothetical protein
MKNVALTLITFLFNCSSYASSPPGTLLEKQILSDRSFSDSDQVKDAFSDTEALATDPREKVLIRLVRDLLVCIYRQDSKSEASKNCTLDPNLYGDYAALAKAVNEKLKVGPEKTGHLIRCAVDELSGVLEKEAYDACLR